MIFKSLFHSEHVSGISWRIPRCKAELELCSSAPRVAWPLIHPRVRPVDHSHQNVKTTPCHSKGLAFPGSCPHTATVGPSSTPADARRALLQTFILSLVPLCSPIA